ncbi:hypothetical protein DNU06_03430 [Putridiphycobacter roseus]|uniref:Uncharacterized protein n=1 Tax=Putridiphycobacter roseus TaxID=2219161 RepID=A0A2W1NTB6_9FLAO|nr:hypothetical protein [Putridiphycobacter roseus]PZE18892.1 hypothetical protein DNU06_03430 [Putridiphycobacter roseus]
MKQQDKNFDQILSSVQGLGTVKPKNDLFKVIQERVQEELIIPKIKLLWIAAAAIIVLMINVYGFTNVKQSSQSLSSTESSTPLTRNFNFYEL